MSFNKHFSFIVFIVAMFLCSCGRSLYSTEYNLDFEYARNDSVPTQWALRNTFLTGYTLALDHEVSRHGRTSLKAEWTGCPLAYSWGGFQSFLPGELVAGKELEISGWVRTKDSVRVCAGLCLVMENGGDAEHGGVDERLQCFDS